MELEKYVGCSKASRKLIKADLVIRNASIVNVFTDRVEPGNIAIKNGMIVGIGDYEGEEELDIHGQYVTSGFINAHLHLESTMVNPQVLIAEAAQQPEPGGRDPWGGTNLNHHTQEHNYEILSRLRHGVH